MLIRYIRDWTNGNNGSVGQTNSHWHEIMAIDSNGTNIALNKPATFSDNANTSGTWNPTWITDGIINVESNYSQTNSSITQPLFAQIDLGALYSIKEVNIRHYYHDARTYHGTKTEVSADGVTWVVIFDSVISGEYVETSVGKTHNVKPMPLISDSFNRADNATTLGTTEVGNKLWQKYGTSVWGISGNQAYCATLNWDFPTYVDIGISDNYDFSIKYSIISTTNQIMWRIISSLNFFVISGRNVRRVINNTWTTVGVLPVLVSGDVIKIQVRKYTHTIFINGVQQFTFTDITHANGTKVGFSTNSTTARFDDFVIDYIEPTPVIPPGPAVNVIEDFLDNTYNFPIIQNPTNPMNRFDTVSLDGNAGYIKSSSQAKANSNSGIVFELQVPEGAARSWVELDYAVDSESDYDFMYIYVNEVEKLKLAGPNVIGTFTMDLLPGTHYLRANYYKDGGADVGTDSLYISGIRLLHTLSVGPTDPYDDVIEDFLDNDYNFIFLQDATYPWNRFDTANIDNNLGHIKSSNTNGNTNSFIIFDIVVPPNTERSWIEIDYGVDSEINYDFFKIYINDIVKFSESGLGKTGMFTNDLIAGTHKLKLNYSKDGGDNHGTDSAFISGLRLMHKVKTINPPFININSISRAKISDEPGMNQSIITVQFDLDVTEYRAMLNGIDYNTGILVHSGTAVSAYTDVQIIIDWNELNIEGENKINIYAKGLSALDGWTLYGSGNFIDGGNFTDITLPTIEIDGGDFISARPSTNIDGGTF